MSFRIGTCNAHAPGSAEANERTIKLAAAKCDVLLVQEADSQVIAALRDLEGWTVVLPGGLGNRNPIAYRSDMFRSAGGAGWRRIYENKPNVKDGPDRSMTWKPLVEVATDLEFCASSVHKIHQALTSHPERLPGWLSSLEVVGPTLEVLRQRHGRVIVGGDWNNPKVFNIPGVLEQEVASPPTFGKRRYDRLYLVGDVTAGKPFKVATPSDHDTLVVPVTLRGASKPAPKPEPTPVPTPREAPVGRLTDLAAAARKSGLKVVELDGWRTRGRPGAFNPRGVLCHHTGGAADTVAYVNWMAREGRSDLPAPLCQLALDRKGTVYVCAAGRANHGGKAKASGPMPAGDANALYVGIEAMNTGSEGWTRTQRDAYVRLVAALCEHYGWPASHVRAHRETSVTGKWDPGLLDMDDFRADVARAIKSEDWFDMATEADLRRIVREEVSKAIGDVGEDVAKELLPGMTDAPKGRWLGSAISNIHNAVLRIEKKIGEKA